MTTTGPIVSVEMRLTVTDEALAAGYLYNRLQKALEALECDVKDCHIEIDLVPVHEFGRHP